jgi:membrane-bound lytic murein transglycosylase B
MTGGKAMLLRLAVMLPIIAAVTLRGHVAFADPYADLVAEAASRTQIPAAWIAAVLHAESRGDARAVSPAGAMGLMQVMPETWAMLRAALGLGNDPFDPRDNILAGATYLRWMRDRYGEAGSLAAYNAGPARYEEHLATGRPLPAETRNYVVSVSARLALPLADNLAIGVPVGRSWQDSSLFPASFARAGEPVGHADIVPVSVPSADSRVADWTALAPQSSGLFIASWHEETPR